MTNSMISEQLFNNLEKKLDYLKKEQIEQIYQAYLTANDAHKGQKRSTGETYISHPIAVACILADMHLDTESLLAAILHDVIEDTQIEKDFIVKKFSATVAELVDGVTKLSKIQFSNTAEAQAESFRKMILAMSNDIRVILIKLADRLHNMRTIESLPEYKRKRIARETLDIYAPIAHRLGIYDIFIELENLSYRTLYPMRMSVIQDSVVKARGNRKEVISLIEKEIHERFAHSQLPNIKFHGREKQIFSIYKKMQRKHLSFNEVMDVYGFRIIVDSIDDCYRALGIVHSLYKPIPGKFKDYIAIPKINGYQSLHTTLFGAQGIPIEIQIRTEKMDQMASKGIAAHWLYKLEDSEEVAHVGAQQWVNDLLEMQQKTGNSLEFLENVKIDLFPGEIYVFTPKGKIMELPRGSTPVDFAYAVHTDVGNSCVSTRIDFKFAPLSTTLISGQTVSIITAPGASPNPAWLNFVKTAKARSGIKHFLKNQKTSEAIDLGKQLLEVALSGIYLNLESISKEAFAVLLQESKLPYVEALYEDIGLGNRSALLVAHQLNDISKQKQLSIEEIANLPPKPLLIQGAEGMVVHFADCCCPVPGDPIIGILNTGKGLTIHSDTCKNISRLRMQTNNCILAKWAEDTKGDFMAILNLEMSSRRGSFALVAKAISDEEASIEDITINQRTGEHYSVILKLFVRNRDHLQNILHRLSALPIVVKASRI
jgi:GTP diphosphokinase / guanosine-3',5'-bis(diphosphate) 3'-diphosphatase